MDSPQYNNIVTPNAVLLQLMNSTKIECKFTHIQQMSQKKLHQNIFWLTLSSMGANTQNAGSRIPAGITDQYKEWFYPFE